MLPALRTVINPCLTVGFWPWTKELAELMGRIGTDGPAVCPSHVHAAALRMVVDAVVQTALGIKHLPSASLSLHLSDLGHPSCAQGLFRPKMKKGRGLAANFHQSFFPPEKKRQEKTDFNLKAQKS